MKRILLIIFLFLFSNIGVSKADVFNNFAELDSCISGYKSFNNENIIGAAKFYLSTIDGLGSDDVRLSKRKGLSSSRLRPKKDFKLNGIRLLLK